jgi:hypothetical protein
MVGSYCTPARGVEQISSCSVLVDFGTVAGMSDAPERLTLADREDLASALAFALRFSGRKRVHNADEFMGGQKKALKPVHRETGD